MIQYLIFSIFAVFLAVFIPPVAAATNCASVTDVKSTVSAININTDTNFDCLVTVDRHWQNSNTIACGVSINGGWPLNFCPSDIAFKGWQGNTARFGCQVSSGRLNPQDKVTLVGFDFATDCGPTTGKTMALNINQESVSAGSTNTNNGLQTLTDLLKIFFSVNTSPSALPATSDSTCQGPAVCTTVYRQCNGIWGVCDQNQSTTYPTCVNDCYAIDYRNINIVPKSKQNVIDYVNAAWPNNRLEKNYDNVYRFAENNNWSPAFLMALWIEESGGGAASKWDFGCGAPSLTQYQGIDNQLRCLTNAIAAYNTAPWPQFACMYSEGHYPCQFTINGNFLRNLRRVYNNVVNGF